ncbi:aquaporin-like protein [Trypanosoma grayi]|uniref:aquaporin-like protein n=1 Tax=Trypanosoma grayi TaxID=71804 RepID=UPI0004F455D0|nr:aquaporin-like protein [Trypanosoma grayi]KEG13551.1 aquaporin-like protein [Trypanosoma grayi]
MMPNTNSPGAHGQDKSSGIHSTEKATAPALNRHVDPLECGDDDVSTVATPTALRPATPSQPQPQPQLRQQTPREVRASQEAAAENVMPGSRAATTAASTSGRQSTVPSQPSATSKTQSVHFSPLAESEKEKSGIKVDVTTDGITRSEELDPRELARLYAQQQAALRSIRGEFDILYVPDWVRLHPLLGSYVAEAFGTFACVLTLSLVSVRNQSLFDKSDDTNMTAVPIGFMFMSMVFTFGYISGGHFNPAVTVAVFLVRKIDIVRAVGYMICQTGASLGAGLVAMAIQGSTDIFVPHVDTAYVSSGIFSELIFTFAVSMVVLNVAYSRQSGNFFYGFAIGMTIAAGSAAVGRISGGAFNPAAATGLQLALCLTGDCDPLSSFWVYWMAPLVGSVIAAILYSQISQPEDTQVLSDAAVLQEKQPMEEMQPVP